MVNGQVWTLHILDLADSIFVLNNLWNSFTSLSLSTQDAFKDIIAFKSSESNTIV